MRTHLTEVGICVPIDPRARRLTAPWPPAPWPLTPSKDANGNMILTASLDRDAVNDAPSFMTLEDIKAKAPSSPSPSSAPRTP